MIVGCAVCAATSLCWSPGCAVFSNTPLSSVVQSTELPSLSTDRHLVYPLKASFALSRGELSSVPTMHVPTLLLTPERLHHSACQGFLLGLGVVECHLTGKDLGGHFDTVRAIGQVLDHLRVDDATHLLHAVNGTSQAEL